MSFWPKDISFQDILINSLGSLIAGSVWSLFILILTFVMWNFIDITSAYGNTTIVTKTTAFFPIILSIITLIWVTITVYTSYFLLSLTSPERYKRNTIIAWQLGFFIVFTYILITPVYLFAGLENYDYILYVYLFHVLISAFGTSILLEILNNYRYILTGIYWSFLWFFISIILAIIIFQIFDSGVAKLITLVVLLPIINFSLTFFKQLFELAYLHYYRFSNQDGLWDIFYQIELEEKEELKQEEQKASL